MNELVFSGSIGHGLEPSMHPQVLGGISKDLAFDDLIHQGCIGDLVACWVIRYAA